MRAVKDGNMKTALVTGASSGIGAVTAQKLAQEGFRVVLVARRKNRLAEIVDQIQVVGGDAYFMAADLADDEDCLRVYKYVKNNFNPLNVLINNAGFAWYGYGEEMPWTLARQMIKVNITAVTRLTLLFIPEMKKRNDGHIINVGSIAGSIPSQGVALYSATKSFMDALTTSLHRELRGSNVHISVVRAGAVATPFFDTASSGQNGMRVPAERFAIKPEIVADRILHLIRKPTRIVYVPRALYFVPWLELCFGWLMDLIGPLLLKRQHRHQP